MKKVLTALFALPVLIAAGYVAAQPDYRRIELTIDIDRPAAEVWAKVGGYCDISDWLGLDCEITSGDGGIGTVRVLNGGRVTEIMVAQTDLSYGYSQPVREGVFYNQYHGFMEARPTGPDSSMLIYTIMMDVSNLEDQAAMDSAIQSREERFGAALLKMKEIAETF